MSSVVITGALGFIGSHLADRLISKGHAVTIFDACTYAALTRPKGASFVKHTLGSPKNDIYKFESYELDLRKTDVIFHLAAESMVDRSDTNMADFVNSNITGTKEVLDGARKYKIPVIHMSTDEVFGTHEPGDNKSEWDEYSPLNPRNLYAITKASAEMLAKGYHETYNMDVRVVRSCNVYGPRQHVEKFIPKAILCQKNNSVLPLYPPGDQVRQWLYVDDVVNALETVWTKGQSGGIYNIAPTFSRTKGITNLNLLDMIEDVTDKKIRIEFKNLRKVHDHTYRMSCKNIRKLGWEQETDLLDGLFKTSQYYGGNY